MFFATAAALVGVRALRTGSERTALACVGLFSVLALTRSSFHPALVLIVAAVLVLAAPRQGVRRLVLLGLIALVPTGWMAKNRVQYGFLGTSSWYGMSMWRAAAASQDMSLVQRLVRAEALPAVVLVPPFSAPSSYRPLGYTDTSPVPALADDDFHNVNVPAISSAYAEAARALISLDPAAYLRTVRQSYLRFTAPLTSYPHLAPNRERIRPLAVAYEWAAGDLGAHSRGPRATGSLWSFLLPTLLVWMLAVASGRLPSALDPGQRRALAALAGVLAYVTAVSCLMEYGENVRFRFAVQPVLIVSLFTAIVWALDRGRTRPAP